MTALDNLASLPLCWPELVLVAGIFAVLLLGLLDKSSDRRRPAALTALTAVLVIVATLLTGDGQARGLFGGLLARDPFADFFKLLAPAAALLVTALTLRARDAVDFDATPPDREAPEFHALLLTAVLGVHLMASATDLLLAYVGLELTSLMSYVLAGFTRGSRRSAEAALKYVVYGGVASGAMLYGLSLLYGLAGSTDIAACRAALGTAPAPVALVIVGLSLAGLGYKVAVVPFHNWCPDVYEGAPTPVAAFLSVAPKAGGFALVIRFFGDISPSGAGPVPWAMLALAIAVLTMTFGNLAALSQKNIKRLLAYSSIAHAGYLFAGIAVGPPAGHQAVLFYLGAYLCMNLCAFGVVIAVVDQAGRSAAPESAELIENWAGLGRRAPLLALVMAVALFALAGMPPSAGFLGKYYLFSALVAAGRAQGQSMYLLTALVAVANSVLSLYYYLRVIRTMYIQPGPDSFGAATPPSRPLGALLLGLALVTVGLGVYWAPLDALATASIERWASPASALLR